MPHLAFINKLDRTGARPDEAIKQMRAKLNYNAAAIQFPIGMEDKFEGVIDIITNKAYYFRGEFGENVEEAPVPSHLDDACQDKYYDLVEAVANADDKVNLPSYIHSIVDSHSSDLSYSNPLLILTIV